MFDNLFGNLEEKQAEMKAKLAEIVLETEVADGAIKVVANAAREIQDIVIDPEKIDLTDTDQLQDLMVLAMNQTMAMIAEAEGAETKKLMDDMLPSGLGGLGNLFGR